ncbi:eCIS core domain-containing protein [Pantanalinema sp. GBBB05]|uniref:eCIS core domain-containing protein n=1 Tax=Pantanalinema sp. GBBB05 TaxID=2604139 RepID=UPI001D32F113|nr:DUF4157 domain-containing protein [Pantanalinema sp. GBBB05]
MASRSRLRKKVAPEFTPAPTQNVVQSRPFAPSTQANPTPTIADVQAQLDHAQHFGHHLANYAQPQSTPIIQTKLTIGAPGDKYEQEADRVAGQVVQQLHSPQVESPHGQRSVQRESAPEEDELQMQPLADQIQREEMPEEDELQMKPMLQLQGGGAVAATTELESAIQQSRSSGQPLAESIRQPMEHAFGGVDFSGVKVHTDAQSDQLNRSIQAKAFTNGQDVFFRQGAYQPENRGGQQLLAHELTHVVQQTNGQVKRLLQPSVVKTPSALVDDEVHQAKDSTPETKHAIASTVIQREWESSSEDSNIQVSNDYESKGFVWYYNQQTQMMFYKTLPNLLKTVKDKQHRTQIEQYAGTPHTYQQWLEYGWGSQGQSQPISPPVEQKEPKTPKDYSGVTAGVEQEITAGGFKVNTVARGRLGKVVRIGGDQGTLVEFETDMASSTEKDVYTLEFKTTPCSLDDPEGLQLRSAAQKFLVAEIRAAAGKGKGQLKNKPSDTVELKVDRANFAIINPKSKMSFGNQLTMGVKSTDLLGAATKATGDFKPSMTDVTIKDTKKEGEQSKGDQAAKLILIAANWFKYPLSEPLMTAFKGANKENENQGKDDAAACYNLLAQLVMFMSDQMMEIAAKAEKQSIQKGTSSESEKPLPKTGEELGKTVINDEGFPILDTSLPIYKNAFGTLPKTSPMQWLKVLPGGWQTIVRQAVGTPPSQNKAPANVYASVWKFIQQGQALAGHPIPLFTIQGDNAVAFEFRSFPSTEESLKNLKYTE